MFRPFLPFLDSKAEQDSLDFPPLGLQKNSSISVMRVISWPIWALVSLSLPSVTRPEYDQNWFSFKLVTQINFNLSFSLIYSCYIKQKSRPVFRFFQHFFKKAENPPFRRKTLEDSSFMVIQLKNHTYPYSNFGKYSK